jgi:D-tyrosyl-tRNA(Tyr) deacylase
MRLILQRVSSASVRVEEETVSSIGPGLLVLVGVERADRRDSADHAAEKLAGLRLLRTGRAA